MILVEVDVTLALYFYAIVKRPLCCRLDGPLELLTP